MRRHLISLAVLALAVPTALAAATTNAYALTGYQRISSAPIQVPAGTAIGAQVLCPPGTVDWGGGAGFSGTVDMLAGLTASTPVPTAWRARFGNRDMSDTQFSVTAICAPKPPGYALATANVIIHPGMQGGTTAVCPLNSVVLSGGTSSSSGLTQALVLNFFPISSRKFRGAMYNGTGGDIQLSVFSLCARKPAGYQITSFTSMTTLPAPDLAGTDATCAGTRKVIGGGIKIQSPHPTITFGSATEQTDSRWGALVIDLDPAPVTMTAYAICVS
jgi:hypothetical protein